MFIGHLPGAYLFFRATAPNIGRAAFAAAMIGAVIPDVDMLWFYFVDQGAHHHHSYLTHRPAIWVGIVLLGLLLRAFQTHAGTVLAFFGAGGLVHLALDSVVGNVAWAWPFSNYARPLVEVQATHSHWILSFLNHWTFAIEICLVLVASLLWPRRSAANKP